MKLVQIIEEGMKKVNAQRTEKHLGDRSEYIGASDLGQCPRKAVMEKIFGTEPDLVTLIRFERGHLSENILGEALAAEGYSPKRQTELTGKTKNGTPLKFHLDFTFQGKNRFAILEGKSTAFIPASPYEGWEMQLHAQMGLARDVLGEDVEIDGAIFALNMAPKEGSDPYGAWNGYKPSQGLWESLQDDADTIYQAVQEYKSSGNLPGNLPCRPGPLCGFCPCLNDCPLFQGEQVDALAPQVQLLMDLQLKRKKLEDMEKDVKNKLKSVLRGYKGWVNVAISDTYSVKAKVNKKSSRRTDFKAVSAALESYGDDMSNYQNASSHEEVLVKPVTSKK